MASPSFLDILIPYGFQAAFSRTSLSILLLILEPISIFWSEYRSACKKDLLQRETESVSVSQQAQYARKSRNERDFAIRNQMYTAHLAPKSLAIRSKRRIQQQAHSIRCSRQTAPIAKLSFRKQTFPTQKGRKSVAARMKGPVLVVLAMRWIKQSARCLSR